LPVSEA
jgi:hypothetical protein